MLAAWYDFDWVPDFMGAWWFLLILGLLFVGLIGLLIFLRTRRSED